MEIYLKRYYWVAILLTIALCALLIARTGNSFVGAALEPAPLLGLDQGSHGSFVSTVSQITSDAQKLGHLFGIEPPPPAPDALAGGAAGAGGLLADGKQNPRDDKHVCYTCAPVKTGLRVQLLAAMVANEKQWSTALVSDLDKQMALLIQVGDPVPDKNSTVFDITRDPTRVIIVNHETHKLEYIDDTPGTGTAAATVGVANIGTSEVPPAGGDDNIKKIDDTHRQIPRETLDKYLGDMNSLATQARIVPSFKNGQADGFKLFSIQPGSVYSALGIQNGDVIQSINGLEINSPEKALEAYTRLKDAGNFDIKVDRRGSPLSLNYAIQ
jgi:general secretion pathway protein C